MSAAAEPSLLAELLVERGGQLDRFTRRVAFVGLVGLLAVAVVTMADVLLRWLFSAPIEGFEDVGELLFAVIVATCFPAGLLQGHNITIRFLGRGLGKRTALWLEWFGATLTLVFFVFVAWQLVIFAVDEMENHRFTQTLEMATAPWWWAVTAIIAVCVPVQFLVAVAALVRAITGRVPDTSAHEETPDFLADIEPEDG